MVFRDDLDALQARNEALEADLAEFKAEAERLGRVEAERDRLATLLKKLPEPEAYFAERERARKRLVGAVSAAVLLPLLVGVFLSSALFSAERQSRVYEATIAAKEGEIGSLERSQQILRDSERRLRQELEGFGPVVFNGRVTEATGEAPASVGDLCIVTVTPARVGPYNCRAVVICDDRVLYGREGQGYLTCRVREGQPSGGQDVNTSGDRGDPRLDLDLIHGTVVVYDGPSPDWSVTVELEDR